MAFDFERFRRTARQSAAVTGRPSIRRRDYLTSQIEAQLASQRAAEATQAQIRQGERRLDLAEQQAEDIREAATVSGAVDIAGLGISALAPNVEGVSAADKLFTGAGSVYEKLKGIIPGAAGVAGTAPAVTGVGAGVTSAAAPMSLAPEAAATVAGTTGTGTATSLMGVAAPIAGLAGAALAAEAGHERGAAVSLGAAAGSIVPGVGTAIGAGIGYAAGWFLDDVLGIESVLCTELNRQGYLPKKILRYAQIYKMRHIDDELFIGYLWWASKVVYLMQKSWLFTQIVRPFGVGWSYHMAHQIKPSIPDSTIGKYFLKVMIPITRGISKFIRRNDYATA